MTYEPPITREKLEKDLESHQQRGKINDKPVVRFDPKIIEAAVPRQLWNTALQTGAAFDFDQNQIVIDALKAWVTDQRNIAARQEYQQYKAEKHAVSVTVIRGKVAGAYKRRKRELKLTASLES